MKRIEELKEIVRKVLDDIIGDRLMETWDFPNENPDSIDVVKEEAIDKVEKETGCEREKIREILEEVLQLKDIKHHLSICMLYGGIKRTI